MAIFDDVQKQTEYTKCHIDSTDNNNNNRRILCGRQKNTKKMIGKCIFPTSNLHLSVTFSHCVSLCHYFHDSLRHWKTQFKWFVRFQWRCLLTKRYLVKWIENSIKIQKYFVFTFKSCALQSILLISCCSLLVSLLCYLCIHTHTHIYQSIYVFWWLWSGLCAITVLNLVHDSESLIYFRFYDKLRSIFHLLFLTVQFNRTF